MCALIGTDAILAISLPSTKHGLPAWIEIIRMLLNGVLVQRQTICGIFGLISRFLKRFNNKRLSNNSIWSIYVFPFPGLRILNRKFITHPVIVIWKQVVRFTYAGCLILRAAMSAWIIWNFLPGIDMTKELLVLTEKVPINQKCKIDGI